MNFFSPFSPFGSGVTPVIITGNPYPGETLTSTQARQWYLNGAAISGQTAATLVIPWSAAIGDLITQVGSNAITIGDYIPQTTGIVDRWRASTLTGYSNLQRVATWTGEINSTAITATANGGFFYDSARKELFSGIGSPGTMAGTYAANRRSLSILITGRMKDNGTDQTLVDWPSNFWLQYYLQQAGLYDGGTPRSFTYLEGAGRPYVILVRCSASAVTIHVNTYANSATYAAAPAGTVSGFSLPSTRASRSEMVIWNRELTANEAQAVMAYGTKIYDSRALSGGGISGRVTMHGDSTTQGSGSQLGDNTMVQIQIAATWFARNYGQPGETLTQIYNNRTAAWYGLGSTSWLLMMGGINDILANETGATVYTRFQTYWNAAIAASIGTSTGKRVVFTLSASSLTSGQTTALVAYNASVRANALTYGHYLVDVANDSLLGFTVPGSVVVANSSASWVDGVHYSQTGYGLLAAKIRAEVPIPF